MLTCILPVPLNRILKNSTVTSESRQVITTLIGPLNLENCEQNNKDTEMAKILNEHFASVFTVEDCIDKAFPDQSTVIRLENIIPLEN